MKRKTIWILAGVVAAAGTATAIAGVGDREARWGPRGAGHYGVHGGGDHGFGEGRHHRHFAHRRGDDMERSRSGRRGWWRGKRSVTEEDFEARARARFARLDANSDGVLDVEELQEQLGRRSDRRRRFGDRMMSRRLARLDTDRDGKITRQEFDARAGVLFERFDLTRDGRITDDDLPPFLRGRDVLKDETALVRGRRGFRRWMLRRLVAADADKDGIITREEALAAAGKRFERHDRNRDGVIDEADREAMNKEMAAYRAQRFLHRNGAGPDGKLTREQYFKSAKQRFTERDINNDGRIDRQDYAPRRDRGGPGGPDRPRGPAGDGPGQRL